jgi:GAF domain-containing protein
VPLISGGEVIGLCSMDKAEVGFFTEEHARLAEVLAAHGAVAFEHARLLRDLRFPTETRARPAIPWSREPGM